MVELGEMMRRHAQAGQVTWIGLRPARREAMTAVERAELTEAGLTGDHAPGGPRALTLIQSEHLAVIGAIMAGTPVAPELIRRNIVVSGLNLAAAKRRRLRIGTALIEIGSACAPCSRMEETLGYGGYSAVRGHGGWYARVLEPGQIAVSDSVEVVADEGHDLR